MWVWWWAGCGWLVGGEARQLVLLPGIWIPTYSWMAGWIDYGMGMGGRRCQEMPGELFLGGKGKGKK